MSNETSLRERHPCPKCGRKAEWLEEHPQEIEYGCEKNHRWFVEK
jgi:hypothetical protein